jgi:hypothetical protein
MPLTSAPQLFEPGVKKRYDFQTLVIYVGWASSGNSEASTGWTIKRTTLDATGNPTVDQWTGVGIASWNNRVNETYS